MISSNFHVISFIKKNILMFIDIAIPPPLSLLFQYIRGHSFGIKTSQHSLQIGKHCIENVVNNINQIVYVVLAAISHKNRILSRCSYNKININVMLSTSRQVFLYSSFPRYHAQ